MFGTRRSLNLIPSSIIFLASFYACSVSKHIQKNATAFLLKDTAISKGFIGISIYDPATSKFLYQYNADHYFIPASNTKLFTLYAGLKFLDDSLVGLRYLNQNDSLYVEPTGDPTFLYSDFERQPVADFLKTNLLPIAINDTNFQTEKYGSGWAWDEYMESYMPERSAFPVGGNNLKINFKKSSTVELPSSNQPGYFLGIFPILKSATFSNTSRKAETVSFEREERNNSFTFAYPLSKIDVEIYIPFVTNGLASTVEILNIKYPNTSFTKTSTVFPRSKYSILHTQPKDSLFKAMMHRSDNFFAEQTLLMASNEYLGYMNEQAIIDTVLKKDFRDIPSRPRWVDGSGLSRYNLFTPNDMIYILNKLKNEFSLDRLKNILATGGEGTLKNYFHDEKGFIFAKTGTLSNNCALSGYLITDKGRLLLFSVIANNYQSGATPVRRAVEKFVRIIRTQN